MDKHASVLGTVINYGRKKLVTFAHGVNVTITLKATLRENKLEFLLLAS